MEAIKSKRRLIGLGSLLVLGLTTLGIVLWFIVGAERGLATTSNPCTVDDHHYDVNGESRMGGVVRMRHYSEVSPSAIRVVFTDPADGVIEERIRTGSGDRSERASELPAPFGTQAIEYRRYRNDESWSSWRTVVSQQEGVISTGGSPFCSHNRNDFTSLTNEGTEIINNVSTTKYTAIIEADNDPNEVGLGDVTMSLWVDSDGRLRQRTIGVPATQQENKYTFENHGQINSISIPNTSAESATATVPAVTTPVTSTSTPVSTIPGSTPEDQEEGGGGSNNPTETPTREPATPMPITLATPDTPSIRTSVERGGTIRADLDWNDVTGATRYQIQMREGQKGRWSNLSAFAGTGLTSSINGSSATIRGITNNNNAFFRVRASKGTVKSSWSQAVRMP